MNELTARERAAIHILLFIVKILNPTGHNFQVKALAKEMQELFNDRPINAEDSF